MPAANDLHCIQNYKLILLLKIMKCFFLWYIACLGNSIVSRKRTYIAVENLVLSPNGLHFVVLMRRWSLEGLQLVKKRRPNRMWPVELQVLLNRVILRVDPPVIQEAHQTRVRSHIQLQLPNSRCQPA
uniref:Uncharacterized protein n=1 Tax=Aegilops tauschii subsp. strangulata TaxID=200361 RepID=A0A453QVF0_AEGTS